MKRVLSLVLTAAMLLGGMTIVPTVASAATLDTKNVAAEAYYFGGKVTGRDVVGDYDLLKPTETNSNNIRYDDEEFEVKDGDPSKGRLVLDGVVTKEEWGDPLVVVDSKYAATNGGLEYRSNTDYETASAENTYYYTHNTKVATNPKAPKNGLKFEYYMMWDEDYLYVAAKLRDPDGHSSGKSADKAWDGDTLQVRVDTKGPNSVVNGTGYDALGNAPNTDFDSFIEPWSDIEYNDRRGRIQERVCNFVFTYSSASKGRTEKWDAALRWVPDWNEKYVNKDGETEPIYEYHQHDVSDRYYLLFDNEDELPGDEGIIGTAYPKKTAGSFGRPDTWDTCYEFAIPWELVDEEYSPFAGSELGVSAVLFNAAPGGNYNSWLTWGSGICRSQLAWDPQTAGGSNSVTLSDKPYTTARCSHETFLPADCITCETCAECGYTRGFVTGHSYTYSDIVVPNTEDAGTITATCTVCGDKQVKPIAPQEGKTFYSFTTSASNITGLGLSSGFTATWLDGPNDSKTNERTGNPIIDKDNGGKNKNSYNTTIFPGEAIADLYTDGSDLANVDPSLTNADHTGTYFDTTDRVSDKYSYIMELYFPKSLDVENDLVDHDYTAGIRNVFGNVNKFGFYSAGLFRIQNEFFFAIISNNYGDGTSVSVEDFKKNALAWVPVTEEELATEKWHTYAFMFDEDSATAMFAWDGELKVAATDYHMMYEESGRQIIPFFRRYNVGLYVRNVRIGDTGLFDRYAGGEAPAVKYTATINGVSAKYKAGETVAISAPAEKTENDKPYQFANWVGDTDVLTADSITMAETEFVMPEHDVTLDAEYAVAKRTVTVNGVSEQYEVGATVAISTPETKDGEDGDLLSFVKWTGDADLLADAEAAATEFIMPNADVKLDAEYKTVAVGDLDGDEILTAKDSNILKQMILGKIEASMVGDLDKDGKLTTKDAYLMKKNIKKFNLNQDA